MPPDTSAVVIRPETPSERVALVVWWLARGDKLTTQQVAAITGLSVGHAWRMMAGLSRVVPIYQSGSVWQFCTLREKIA